ncbi:MAG: protein kinase [Myxococcales bacterium]|nr:protein kinase [Myxococcales bacterium]MCB9630023.1 protein kinase [Sandaracinaceae bacterium]
MDQDRPTAKPHSRSTSQSAASGNGWGRLDTLPAGREEFSQRAVVGRGGPRRYELAELLGRGGMGEVHLANDERVGRAVALKVLLDVGQAGEELRARFYREARVQGKLEHPGIVPVYDLDRDETGREFFVMKRVAGVTLETVVRGLAKGDPDFLHKYPMRRLLAAFLQICLTVDYAHAHGVVHRDLKLSNLMLGEYGEVYVLDWGIAKVDGAPELDRDPVTGESSETTGTRADVLLGTLGYMAPEQIDDANEVDARADVYALGVILFSLVTHERLYQQRSPVELADATQQGVVDARPSHRAPHLEIPPELDAICVKATALDPVQRYESARALHDATERVLDGDRDMRLRVELAAQHLEEAKRVLSVAETDPLRLAEGRRQALQQAGRALALHPESEAAAALLTSLMLTPPAHMPPEVERETHQLSEGELARLGSAGAVVLFGALSGVLGLMAWVGVRSLSGIGWFALPLCAGGLAAMAARLQPHRPTAHIVASVFVAIAIAGTSRIAGSLWLPPLLAMTYVAFISWTHGLGRWRLVCFAMALVGALAPWLLELAGLTKSLYVFEGDTVHITADAVAFTPGRAELALAVATSLLVAVCCAALWHFSTSDMAVRRQLQLMAWHLRQLAPSADPAARTPEQAGPPSEEARVVALGVSERGSASATAPDDIGTRTTRRT